MFSITYVGGIIMFIFNTSKDKAVHVTLPYGVESISPLSHVPIRDLFYLDAVKGAVSVFAGTLKIVKTVEELETEIKRLGGEISETLNKPEKTTVNKKEEEPLGKKISIDIDRILSSKLDDATKLTVVKKIADYLKISYGTRIGLEGLLAKIKEAGNNK